MNDTAHLLAAYLESRLSFPSYRIPATAKQNNGSAYDKHKHPGPEYQSTDSTQGQSNLSKADLRSISRRLTDATQSLERIMERAEDRQFEARIYDIVKTHMNLFVYVTDHNGIVLYDSSGLRTGEDLSRMNDVYLTLKGKYGARSSRMVESDPQTGALYVAAPIRYGKHIVGVLTVMKPKDSVTPFIQLAQRRSLTAALLTACAIFLFAGLIFLWVSLPVRKLSQYVSDLRKGRRVQLPSLPRTEIGELGQALDDLRLELEGKNYIEKYIQTLNHEIKSPLTALRGSVELLEEAPGARRGQLVQNIQQETARIQDMIERMLDLATVENQKSVELEPVSLGEILESQKSSLPIRFTASKTGTLVMGDRFLISIAIANIVRNAMEFAESDSEIQVRVLDELESDQSWRILEVENQGPPIPEYALDRIFERFYSLPRKGSGRKSTGLGLPFVQEVMELHGGRVSVRNATDGHGVISRLQFPLPAEN